MTAIEVSQTNYDRIVQLLEQARVERELSKAPGLTLAEKLSLQRAADYFTRLAMSIRD